MNVANLLVTPGAKYIVFSDCHRGDGSAGDEFASNSLLYKCALEYYLKAGFTYIELGDAEELWENKSFEAIYITHTSVYDLLRRFHHPDPYRTRYIKVFGNHDEIWQKETAPLAGVFPGIEVYEAVILKAELHVNNAELALHKAPLNLQKRERNVPKTGLDFHKRDDIDVSVSEIPEKAGAKVSSADSPSILLLHGHQADPVCSGFGGQMSRFLVENLWSGLQRFGIGDPTRAAENPGLCDRIDETLYSWAKKRKMPEEFGLSEPFSIVVAGHTHRPVFANLSLTERRLLESGIGPPGIHLKTQADPVYYNTGSCVHPRCITGMEIADSLPQKSGRAPLDSRLEFTLVKWGYSADAAKTGEKGFHYPLSIHRAILEKQTL